MDVCKRLPKCPFYQSVNSGAIRNELLLEYVRQYCCGPFMTDCYRLVYEERHGVSPADNISPSGLEISKYLSV